MVNKTNPKLSTRRQCTLLNVSRSSVDYQAVEESEEDRRIMRLLDEIYMVDPTLGSRRLIKVLERDHGLKVNRKRVRRLRREMGQESIRNLEKKVEKKRAALAAVGPMRPGSLTCQYRNPDEKTGEYYQLSYTRLSRSRSEHVWPEHVRMMKSRPTKNTENCTGSSSSCALNSQRAKIALLRETSSR